jgi:hypothetical protein
MEKKFKIDFFELSFLVEACIPPRPIARGMFWDEVINDYYHQMTFEEATRLWEWINRNSYYKQRLEENNEKVEVFEARFNPDNQYLVFTEYKGVKDSYKCFKYKDKYYTEYYSGARTKFVSEDHIIKTQKLNEL